MEVNSFGYIQNAKSTNDRSAVSNPRKFVQFKGSSITEMSELTAKEDKFISGKEKAVVNEEKSEDTIIRAYSDGTKEIISNNQDALTQKYYTTIDQYDKSGCCTTSKIEGDNGTYKSTILDKQKRIFKAECKIKNNREKTNATLTYKETRNDIEILEATVNQPDGSKYSVKKETNKYGFYTGKYILTKTDKRGKSESQKVWEFEIKPGKDMKRFKDAPWFKVRDMVFLSDIGLKGIIA